MKSGHWFGIVAALFVACGCGGLKAFYAHAFPEVEQITTKLSAAYRAGELVRKLARRFLGLPQQALKTTAQMLSLAPRIGPEVKTASTSIDNMAPDNPAILALAELPVAPPVKAHSIVAVQGNDVPPNGSDGVVKYTSAHVEGVESELVVRSGHSCQGNPATIEEVRRILMQHLKEVNGGAR